MTEDIKYFVQILWVAINPAHPLRNLSGMCELFLDIHITDLNSGSLFSPMYLRPHAVQFPVYPCTSSLCLILFRAICGSLSSTGLKPGPSSSTMISFAISVCRVTTDICIGSQLDIMPCFTAFSTIGCSVSGGRRNRVWGVSMLTKRVSSNCACSTAR